MDTHDCVVGWAETRGAWPARVWPRLNGGIGAAVGKDTTCLVSGGANVSRRQTREGKRAPLFLRSIGGTDLKAWRKGVSDGRAACRRVKIKVCRGAWRGEGGTRDASNDFLLWTCGPAPNGDGSPPGDPRPEPPEARPAARGRSARRGHPSAAPAHTHPPLRLPRRGGGPRAGDRGRGLHPGGRETRSSRERGRVPGRAARGPRTRRARSSPRSRLLSVRTRSPGRPNLVLAPPPPGLLVPSRCRVPGSSVRGQGQDCPLAPPPHPPPRGRKTRLNSITCVRAKAF